MNFFELIPISIPAELTSALQLLTLLAACVIIDTPARKRAKEFFTQLK